MCSLQRSRTLTLTSAALAALAFWLATAGAGAQDMTAPAAKSKVRGDAYPVDFCVVTGEKLGGMGQPYHHTHDGRDIRFCCKGCVKKFESAPEKYLQKLDAAIIKQQKPFYPLKTCVVMGDPLKGDGWEPVDHVYKNRLIRFCCKKCIRKFNENPAMYLEKLNAAVVKAQLESYPLDTCVVAGGKLGGMGKPVDYVHANRLVRFCCAGCIKTFRKAPLKYLAMIDKALKAKTSGTGE